ncbi:hypothetical protein M427DRAFT_52010 [Gonapodya prolifera JEL478]|uniref:C3H1-type domain-containing protein n=1 Tax=Gonapodya prolifera (strain JEL478) TaxID=1344416 RepID=A0A139AUF5_GONPJ|nr:hypothetical protein M427DRAFT_52010 [Gonapodya prolifera JEL478]|eukprot:KXS20362.1 hypothetical protein M427DRAFT_52010 [Gonapodya prolifera JEL478]
MEAYAYEYSDADAKASAFLPAQLLMSPQGSVPHLKIRGEANKDAPISPISPSSPTSPRAPMVTIAHHAPVPMYPVPYFPQVPLTQQMVPMFGDLSGMMSPLLRPHPLPTPVSAPGSPESMSGNHGRTSQTGKRRMQPPPGSICRYFLQGRCWAGDQCRWSHVMPVQAVYSPVTGQQGFLMPAFQVPGSVSPPPTLALPNTTFAIRPDGTPLSPLLTIPPVQLPTPHHSMQAVFPTISAGMNTAGAPQQCFFWRQGRCKFGSTCRYSHC